MRIVFATGNNDKLREIRQILGHLGLEIVSMKEAGVFEDIEENGTTFAENSVIKASLPWKIQIECLRLVQDMACVQRYMPTNLPIVAAYNVRCVIMR